MLIFRFRKFIEGGLVNYQNLQWRAAKPPCSIADEIPAVAVNTVSFALWLQLFGVVLSLLLFASELLLGTGYSTVSLREKKISLGSGFEPGYPALRAGALIN